MELREKIAEIIKEELGFNLFSCLDVADQILSLIEKERPVLSEEDIIKKLKEIFKMPCDEKGVQLQPLEIYMDDIPAIAHTLSNKISKEKE